MNYLREKNVARAAEDFKTYKNAGLLYFTTAVAGEGGELAELILSQAMSAKIGGLCNLVKKVERAKVGGPDIGHTSRLKDITHEKLKDEIGGLLIYIDLLASLLGIDCDEAIVETFNRVSREIGSQHFLSDFPTPDA